MARSPIVAVIMAIIPIVDLYLIYKWLEEFKAATKASYNSIIQLILWLIPIVDLYFVWKFMSDLEAAAKKKGDAGYPMGATVFFIATIVLSFFMIGLILALFMAYRTQEMLNKL
jgi:hypothetical protein